ncbi:hypothetical protein HK098_006294 [Nowakowskiella sp. JEL0407]|nr:hypothetical protein HK098_006294 [Nowakowskiella sp. JEL0407]
MARTKVTNQTGSSKKTSTGKGITKQTKSNVPKTIKSKAAEDEPVPHVVIHSTSSPYEGKQTSRKVYPSQQKANEKIMKQWNEYKDGYDLVECKLFRNDYGCLRPPWELLEVEESQGGGAALNGDRAEIEEIVSERESKDSANDEDDEDDDFSDY